MYTRKWQEIDEREQQYRRSESNIAEVIPDVERIVAAVRKSGDEELMRLNTRFNQTPTNWPLKVTDSGFEEAEKTLSRDVKQALEYSIENVRRYHMTQEPDGLNWKEIRPGIIAGERTSALDSAAFYIPRTRGNFPSMLYMMAVPARIAGVGRLSMASPPDEKGRIDPACLYVARLCGIDEIYAMGGAQAWAAFAYGTQTINRVHKCLGPGNKYVAAAKRLLSDVMDCSLPTVPSESIILADRFADAEYTARNLLVEAEHGEDSSALLITDSEDMADSRRDSSEIDRGPAGASARLCFKGYDRLWRDSSCEKHNRGD